MVTERCRSQDGVSTHLFDERWLLVEYDRPEDKFISPSLGVEIGLADLYKSMEY